MAQTELILVCKRGPSSPHGWRRHSKCHLRKITNITPTITTRCALPYIMILLNSNIDSVQWQKTYYNAHIVTREWQPQLMHGSQAFPHRTRRIAHPIGYQNQIHPQCPENRTSHSIPSDLSKTITFFVQSRLFGQSCVQRDNCPSGVLQD